MVKEWKHGQMVLNMKEIMFWAKNKGWVIFYGLIILVIQESFKIIIFMEKDYINGQMVEFLMEIGYAIKWMEKDYLHGAMAECKLILFRFKG